MKILKSWKDIAAYLEVAVSTARRWERDFELPVRRAGGKRGSAIVALPREIDDWLKTHLFVKDRGTTVLNAFPDSPPDSSKQPEEIIITDLLWNRPSRPPDLNRELEAFRMLGREMLVQNPSDVLNSLVGHAISLCKAESAGISLLEKKKDGKEAFRWVAATGTMESFVGSTFPRDFSPSGICLERNCAQLFSHPERYFTYLNRVLPMAELLLIPFYRDNEGLGTLWVICHDTQRKFDREDVRILSSLADFTAATLFALRLQQQQQAEDLIRSLIQGIPNIVFAFDRNGNTIFVNEQWTVYSGMSYEQGLGWGWRAAVHPNDLPGYQKIREVALATGQGYDTEYRMKRKDGHYRWQLVRVVPVKDDTGAILRWFGTCTDIDEKKFANQASLEPPTKREPRGTQSPRSHPEQESPRHAGATNSQH
jgi:PAS domain S-box-containing protein